MMDPNHPTLSISRQCHLLAVSRSALYDRPVQDHGSDLELMALIDRQFLETPYYGSRKMTAWLRRQGHAVNRKREQRMRCSTDAPDGAGSDLSEAEH
jgi:putative transposase